MKSCETFRFDGFSREAGYSRSRGGVFPKIRDKRVDRGAGAFHDDLHALGRIHHPTSEAMLPSETKDEWPKPDTLHDSANANQAALQRGGLSSCHDAMRSFMT